MERRPDRFTALIDANALVPALIRNALLTLAEAELFRPRWSSRILGEMERGLQKAHPAMSAATAKRQRANIERAFPEALVTGFEDLEPAFANGPDPDDAHVMAAARRCDAHVIVTSNLKHFPSALLVDAGLEARAPDKFIADIIDLDQIRCVAAFALMRRDFRKPELTSGDLLMRMTACGLTETVQLLRPHLADL